ncbi:MAG: TolC family protein [Gemmatimonadota bacterium]
MASAMLLAVGGFAAPAESQDATYPTVSLEQAMERALEHSPQLAQASGAIRGARAAERSAFGAYLPSLSLSTGSSLASSERLNTQTNTTVTGSSDSYNAGLNASVDLYTGGRRGAMEAQTTAETAAALAGLTEAEFDVVLGVKRTFYDGLRASELIRVAETQVERALEGLDAAQRRMDVGSATRSDVLRSQLELTNARQSLLDAENQRRTAAYALGRLVGSDGPVAAAGADLLRPVPLAMTEPEVMDLVAAQAPGVLSARADLRSSEAGERAARTQYLPSLRLSSGYNWFNQNPAFTDGRTSWQVGLSLSYPIFNGFQREETMERARVGAAVAQVQVGDAERAARAEAQRVYGSLRLAEQRIALNEEALEVAEEDLRVQQERYRLGSTTILEMITSQTNLLQAETDLVTSRFDYHMARAELEALVGSEL